MTTDSSNLMIVSSDGHAGALMADWRPYLEKEYLDDFDRFLPVWDEYGSRNFDRPALEARLDPELVDQWTEVMVDTKRIDAFPDPHRRIEEIDREGVTAEILFPDFGIAFQLSNGLHALSLGNAHLADEEHMQAGMRAFNRWLPDYMSVAPERFAGLAFISWLQESEQIVAEIRQAHASGLKGIVLPKLSPEKPLFHPDYEIVWSELENLGMVVNTHASISSTTNQPISAVGAPHPACGVRIFFQEHRFFIHNMLSHFIWGGVLDRHPALKLVLTEQGSGWVMSQLADMDYAYEGSFFRTDFHDVIRLKPSEYFRRQCYLGSSIFSRAEIAARELIGLDKMMIGMDIPHHEGTLIETTQEYLKATLGAEHVPLDEARQILGKNAIAVFGFDEEKLAPIAARIGLRADEALSPPERDLFPCGDVHKPISPTA